MSIPDDFLHKHQKNIEAWENVVRCLQNYYLGSTWNREKMDCHVRTVLDEERHVCGLMARDN